MISIDNKSTKIQQRIKVAETLASNPNMIIQVPSFRMPFHCCARRSHHFQAPCPKGQIKIFLRKYTSERSKTAKRNLTCMKSITQYGSKKVCVRAWRKAWRKSQGDCLKRVPTMNWSASATAFTKSKLKNLQTNTTIQTSTIISPESHVPVAVFVRQ